MELLSFREYHDFIKETLDYPGQNGTQGLNLVSIILAGEIGEIMDAVKRINFIERDGGNPVKLMEAKKNLEEEVGDSLCCLSMMMHEAGLSPEVVWGRSHEKLKKRLEDGTLTRRKTSAL